MSENEGSDAEASKLKNFRVGLQVGGLGGIIAAVALVVAAHRLGTSFSSSVLYWIVGVGCAVWALWDGYVFQRNVPKALGMIVAWLLVSAMAALVLGVPVGLTCLGASAYYVFDSWNWTGTGSEESA